jgi:hypothetical protein
MEACVEAATKRFAEAFVEACAEPGDGADDWLCGRLEETEA